MRELQREVSVSQGTIRFTCRVCKHRNQVSARYAGKTGKCGDCKATLRVPDAPTAEEPPKREAKVPGRGSKAGRCVACHKAIPRGERNCGREACKPAQTSPLLVVGGILALVVAGGLTFFAGASGGAAAVVAVGALAFKVLAVRSDVRSDVQART